MQCSSYVAGGRIGDLGSKLLLFYKVISELNVGHWLRESDMYVHTPMRVSE